VAPGLFLHLRPSLGVLADRRDHPGRVCHRDDSCSWSSYQRAGDAGQCEACVSASGELPPDAPTAFAQSAGGRAGKELGSRPVVNSRSGIASPMAGPAISVCLRYLPNWILVDHVTDDAGTSRVERGEVLGSPGAFERGRRRRTGERTPTLRSDQAPRPNPKDRLPGSDRSADAPRVGGRSSGVDPSAGDGTSSDRISLGC